MSPTRARDRSIISLLGLLQSLSEEGRPSSSKLVADFYDDGSRGGDPEPLAQLVSTASKGRWRVQSSRRDDGKLGGRGAAYQGVNVASVNVGILRPAAEQRMRV